MGAVPVIVPTYPVEGGVNPPVFKARAAAPAAIVTVPVPDWLLNHTSSLEVGADAPPDPPGEVDQLVVFVLFHVPVPPTQ